MDFSLLMQPALTYDDTVNNLKIDKNENCLTFTNVIIKLFLS